MTEKRHPQYLLTPGPLTTAYAVKEAMLRDWGSWDGDFRAMTASLRAAPSPASVLRLASHKAGAAASSSNHQGSSKESSRLHIFQNRIRCTRWL